MSNPTTEHQNFCAACDKPFIYDLVQGTVGGLEKDQ